MVAGEFAQGIWGLSKHLLRLMQNNGMRFCSIQFIKPRREASLFVPRFVIQNLDLCCEHSKNELGMFTICRARSELAVAHDYEITIFLAVYLPRNL